MRILELIGEGLGLEVGYFKEKRSSGHGLAINYYPPCLEPSLALGIGAHYDVISNGKLRSTEHRGVTNLDSNWISIVNFFGPSKKCLTSKAKALVSTNNPLRFRSFKYIEFLEHYMACLVNKDLRLETTLRPYELQT
ncbi:hypothetical protein LguiA_013007 [Lonicera macranthoides]